MPDGIIKFQFANTPAIECSVLSNSGSKANTQANLSCLFGLNGHLGCYKKSTDRHSSVGTGPHSSGGRPRRLKLVF